MSDTRNVNSPLYRGHRLDYHDTYLLNIDDPGASTPDEVVFEDVEDSSGRPGCAGKDTGSAAVAMTYRRMAMTGE
jgi:hypothetical protein